MNLYKRLTRGLVDKGVLIHKSKNVYDFITSDDDYYLSVYDYSEEQREEFLKTNTVKGVDDVTTDQIWWDFDNKVNPAAALESTKLLVNKLIDGGISSSDILMAFSGQKGFTVAVNTNQRLSPQQVRDTCLSLAQGIVNLDTTVYNPSRILRVIATRHPTTGLYKTPLTYNQLMSLSMDDIRELAANIPEHRPEFRWNPVNIDVAPSKIVSYTSTTEEDIDFTKKAKGWTNCKWSLLNGNFKEGERHYPVLAIIATCKALNYPKETAYYMAKSACKASVSRFGGSEFPKEEIWSEVESVYTPFWKGGTFSCRDGKSPWLTKICSELGVHKCNTEEDYEYKPMRFSDLRNDFKDYVLNIEKNTIKTGIPSIDDAIFLSNNANVVVLGAAGSGKTSLGLEILSNTSKAGVKSVCASLDMAKNRIFEKVLYRLSGIKREPLYDIFKTGQEQSLIDKLDEEFGNVYFFKKSSVSVKDLRNYIISCNESSEEPVKLVVIDYFERITSDLGDDTAASKRIAGEIQDLVDDLGVCVITLVQPNKNSVYGGPDKPLYDYTAIKGSSFVYQSARIIMSVWRPFYSPKDFKNDRFMQVAVLKNDLGELDEFAFGWEGSRGLITELDEFQKEELDMLLKQKQQPNLF